MTSYHIDNLPDEILVDAVPDELFDHALTALTQALDSGQVLAKQALATYVYDRRGYMGFDSFTNKTDTNPNAQNGRDDVIIQVTVRMHNPRMFDGILSETTDLEENLAEHTANAKRERLVAEIARAEADASKAEATAREKREQLDALRKQLPSK